MKKLLAVIDPTVTEQAALERATRMAIDSGAGIHAFCCTYLDENDMGQFSSRKEAKKHELNRIRSWLDELTAPIKKEGVKVTTEAYWNEHWYKSVTHAAARCGADMVIKSTAHHTAMQRTLSPTSDYTLLRYSPCPVLLTRSGEPWQNGLVLASVALDSDDAEHDLLNNAIITEAQRLAHTTNSELHVVTVNTGMADIAALLSFLGEDTEKDGEVHLAERYGVPTQHIHICEGNAREKIVETAERLKADVLVIGTIARKGLGGALIGNTSEKVLDNLTIDVLAVS